MEHERQADRPARKVAEQVRAMPAWKKVLLGVSIALMAAGLALQAYAYVTRPAATPAQPAAASSSGSSSATSGTTASPSGGQPAPRSTAVPGSGFLPSGTGGGGSGESGASRDASPAPTGGGTESSSSYDAVTAPAWQPALFRLGFSFFAGFCIAFALRLFFKAAVAFIGLVLLATFALQYAGLVSIDWSSIAGHADGAMAWAKEQFASFRHFIVGQLPSAGSAIAGLYVGWRKN